MIINGYEIREMRYQGRGSHFDYADNGSHVSRVVTLKAPDGTVRWYASRASAIADAMAGEQMAGDAPEEE